MDRKVINRKHLTIFHSVLIGTIVLICVRSETLAQSVHDTTSSSSQTNVTAQGAKCDGVTDDSAAIQAAIRAACRNDKIITLPSGTCSIGKTTISLNCGSVGVRLWGNGSLGPGATVILYGGNGVALQSSNAGKDVYNNDLRDFVIKSTGAAERGLYCQHCSEFVIRDVTVGGSPQSHFDVGFDLTDSAIGEITHPISSYNKVGIDLANNASIWISKADFFQHSDAAIRVSGTSAKNVISDGWFEKQNYGIKFDDSAPGGAITLESTSVRDNSFVMNGDPSAYPNGISIQVSNTNANVRMIVDGLLIENNRFYMPTGFSRAAYPIVIALPQNATANSYVRPTVSDNIAVGSSALKGLASMNNARISSVYRNNVVYGSGRTMLSKLQEGPGTIVEMLDQGGNATFAGGVQPGVRTFSTLGSSPDGWIFFCSDCAVEPKCAPSGKGAIAKRLNGTWVCN
jgi:hypothetical protein